MRNAPTMILLAALAGPAHALPATQDPEPGVRTTAVWLFDEHIGLYPSSVLHDLSENEYVMVLGRGGRIVPGRFGNALEIADPEPLELPPGEFPDRFGVNQLAPAEGRTVEPMSWSNAYFAGLMTNGDTHLRNEVGFPRPTATALNLGDFDWTVEFWYEPTRARTGEGTVFEIGSGPRGENDMVTRLAVNAAGDGFVLTNGASGTVLHIASSAAGTQDESPAAAWSHFAFVYDASAGQLRHYVDGELQALPDRAALVALPPGEEDYISIGRDGLWQRPLYGRLDELRFSVGQVYTSPFTPRSIKSDYVATPEPVEPAAGPPLLFTQERRDEAVVPIGSRKHLFVDDALVANSENITFAVNPPRVDRCVLPVDGSFRKHLTIIEDDDGRIRLYTAVDDDYLAVWVSDDGLSFREPETGIEHRGRHNIVIPEPVGLGTALRDPNAPAHASWAYISDYHRRGLYLYTSRDGFTFERQRQAVLPFRSGSQNDVFYDDQRQLYAAFHRTDIARTPGGHTQREFVLTEKESLAGPWPFQPATKDDIARATNGRVLHELSPWYLDNGPLTPGGFGVEYPVAFAPEPGYDPVSAGVYNPKALKYPWAPDTYLAFPVLYFHYYEGGPGRQALAPRYGGGPVETQFAASRDGRRWTRYPRPTYFGIGRFDGLDIRQTFIAQGMVRRGDEIWQYAFGDADYHTHEGQRSRERCVYRLVQRFDGFVSADAPYEQYGTITTRPLVFEGERLVLNIDTDAHGYALVGLLDENGAPIPGHGLEDSILINGDFIEREVEWLDKGRDVSGLQGRVVQLVIQMRGAKLYALQFQTR